MKKFLILIASIFVSSAHADVINGFTNEFDPSEWTITVDGTEIEPTPANEDIFDADLVLSILNTNDNTSRVQFSDDMEELILVSNDDQSGDESILDTIFDSASEDGYVSFDWLFDTNDIGNEFFGWLLNDVFTELTDGTIASGTERFAVEAGDVFGFRSISANSRLDPGIATVSGFSFTPTEVPAPSSLMIFAIACLMIRFSKRKSV